MSTTKTTPKASTEVATTKPAGAVATYDPSLTSGWGGMGGVDTADVLIPKLLIMQPISELVTEGKAGAGSIIRSTTQAFLGGKKGGDDLFVPFIPLLVFKDWALLQKPKGSNKFEFRAKEAFTADNANRPWNFTGKDGTEWQANANINLFALLPADIDRNALARKRLMESGELPDPQDALMPVLIQFTRTSYHVGKEVSTHFAQAADMGVPAAVTTLSIYTELVKGEKGSFFVYKLGTRGKTTPEQLTVAKKWFLTLSKAQNAGNLKVHEEEPVEVSAPSHGPTVEGEQEVPF
jgi:hypothetical protein